jgi:ArsR family transcriptional regulator
MNQLVPILKAISEEPRLRILNLLISRGELCVCDIEAILGATQTKISRHLAYLRRSGLVSARRSGLWILYSISPPADEPRKEVLSILPRLLRATPIASRDLQRLDARMSRGCCATAKVSLKFTTKAATPTVEAAIRETSPHQGG